MNSRQLKFCHEYLRSGDATNSAIAAGYSRKTAYSIGSENLRKPELAQYIATFKKQMEEQTAITVESVLTRINALADSAAKESDKLTALDMLSKYLGIYAPKKMDVKFSDFSALTNEELIVLRRLQAKIDTP